MSVTITLHVYSGRPDPAWELSDKEAAQLAKLLQAAKARTFLKPRGVAGGLGYRGFRVQAVGERGLEAETYIHEAVADVGRFDLSLALGSPDAEAFLLSTAGETIDAELRAYVEAALKDQDGGARALSAEGLRTTFAAPPYDPGRWNNDTNIRTRNNCYNYASDKITNTFAQPGRGSGQTFSALTCADVGQASVKDGQVSIPNPDITPADGHIICLVIWPGRDFHWYRRDSNGMWSHKPGQTPARNTDNALQPIASPETCDRGPYAQVCGYYNSIPRQTRIA